MAARKPRPVGWTGPTGATVVAHLHATAVLDNHQPARSWASVTIEEICWPPSDDGFVGNELIIVNGLYVFRESRRALWLIDRGPGKVDPYYTASYHETEATVGLKSVRSGSEHGPSTTYHLKVTEI